MPGPRDEKDDAYTTESEYDAARAEAERTGFGYSDWPTQEEPYEPDYSQGQGAWERGVWDEDDE